MVVLGIWGYVSLLSAWKSFKQLFSYTFSLPGCCGCCCVPCLTHRTANDMGKSGFLYCLLGCLFPCIPAMLLRKQARERYNIEVGRLNTNIWLSCFFRFMNLFFSPEVTLLNFSPCFLGWRWNGLCGFFLLHFLRDVPDCAGDEGEGGQLLGHGEGADDDSKIWNICRLYEQLNNNNKL